MGSVHFLQLFRDQVSGALMLALIGTISFLYLIFKALGSFQRLQHIPGPRVAAWTELWLFQAALGGNFHLTAARLLRKHGTPVRIGPNMIVTDDPGTIRAMTATNSKFRRGHWYKGMRLDSRINNTLSEQDENRHTELRRKLLPGRYNGRDIPSLEARVDERVLELVRVMSKYTSGPDAVDFANIAQYFALDVLTDLAFGESVGFLASESDLFEYIKKSADFLPLMELGTNHPWMHRVLTSRLIAFLAGPKPTDKTGLGAVVGMARKAIVQRYAGCVEEGHRLDMLDSFIAHGLTQIEAESESLLQILAGADSAATCIRMTMLYLMTSPRSYLKLQNEIHEAVRKGLVSSPVIQNHEAAHLPYLRACIKEGLRLWVPLNGLNTKVAPPEGARINDVWIPGGTQVAHAHHAMMRRVDIFGADADIFDPDRWLTGDADTIKRRERVWELSFSYGRSVCLGRPIALMELNKVIVELLRRFEFGLVDPVMPIKTKCHQIHVQEGMFVRVWAAESASGQVWGPDEADYDDDGVYR